MSKTKVSVNVDNAIKHYNNENQEKRQMTRETLVDSLQTKCTITTIQNWKGGTVPKAFILLVEVLELTGCELNDILIIERKDE